DAGPDKAACATPGTTTFSVTGVATPSPGDVVTSTLWAVQSQDPGVTNVSIASPNALTTNVTVTGTGSVTLRFTVNTSPHNCSAHDDVVLPVNPLPDVPISGPTGPVCPSATNLSFSGPPGMSSYSWSISGNGTITSPTNGQNVTVSAGSACGQSFNLVLTV